MSDLTIVCVSKVESFAMPFLSAMHGLAHALDAPFLLAADGQMAAVRARNHFPRLAFAEVESKGYLESVHDEVIEMVSTPYVLRLDDDEKASTAMAVWLLQRLYQEADHWKFPRANLWSPTRYITTPHLWPDHQTRLSTKAKAKGRNAIHAGSPFGGGRPAPCAIEHYKFVVKSYAERRLIAESYDRVQEGYGTGGMIPFNLPEDYYQEIPTAQWTDGMVRHQEVGR